MGRKAWLFANSVAGAEAAAVIYSIIETCKANRISAYDYLNYVYTQLPLCQSDADLEKLLPFNVELA